jgi:hypothetical protein
MLDKIAAGLLVYGPLGIIALVSMLTTLRLYRDLSVERERNRAAENALVERFVAKAESWTTRYHELAEAQVVLMERVEKLLERALYNLQRPPGGGA